MSIGASPERVRAVRFAEQWRGYRTDEVDEFVEQVAEAFDQLEARVRESSDRAAEAERRLLEDGHDQDLSRTLILAQRTADAARREAEAEATRLVGEAEEQARLLVEEAEARRARLVEEVEARMASELGDLTERKASLERDATSLASFVDYERRRLAEELRRQLTWLEQPGGLEPAPLPVDPTPGAFTAALAGIGGDAVGDATSEELLGADPELDPWVLPHEAGDDVVPELEPDVTAVHDAGPDPRTKVDEGAWHDGPPEFDDVPPEDPMPQRAVLEDAVPESGDPLLGGGVAIERPSFADTSGDDTSRDDTSRDDTSRDDTALDDLDQPWRSPEQGDHDGEDHDGEYHEDEDHDGDAGSVLPESGPDQEQKSTSTVVDDPFLAELRRAVDDPEPLGPRDDAPAGGDWGDSKDLYEEGKSSPRFRRRRQR